MTDDQNKKTIRPLQTWSPLRGNIFFVSRINMAFVIKLAECTKIKCDNETLLEQLKDFDYWYTLEIGDLESPTSTKIRDQTLELVNSSNNLLESLENLTQDVRLKIFYELRKGDAEKLKTSLHLIQHEASFLSNALDSYLVKLSSKTNEPTSLGSKPNKINLGQKRGAKSKAYRTEAIKRIEKIWIEETKQPFPKTFTTALGVNGENQFVSPNLLFTKAILTEYEPEIANADIRYALAPKTKKFVTK